MHVAPELGRYDMIIGVDLLEELQIDLKFSNMSIECGLSGTAIPMRPRECTLEESFFAQDLSSTNSPVEESAARLKCILDAKYEPVDLGREVEKCTNLNIEEKDNYSNYLRNIRTI